MLMLILVILEIMLGILIVIQMPMLPSNNTTDRSNDWKLIILLMIMPMHELMTRLMTIL